MAHMLAIVDYGMGNVGSVQNAFLALGADARLTANAADIQQATHIVLPGVGSFTEGMKRLRDRNLITLLNAEVVGKRKPFLGICLGMQLLAESGEEGGDTNGLRWAKGRTRRFKVDEKKFRLPHVGWNDVVPTQRSSLLQNVRQMTFYFVHSYHFVPDNEAIVAGRTDYGGMFVSAIESNNIFGVQFHPEKSQDDGLRLLRNFLQRRNV